MSDATSPPIDFDDPLSGAVLCRRHEYDPPMPPSGAKGRRVLRRSLEALWHHPEHGFVLGVGWWSACGGDRWLALQPASDEEVGRYLLGHREPFFGPAPTDCPVVLRGEGQPPLVLGEEVDVLDGPEWAVVSALVAAYPGGLSCRELDETVTPLGLRDGREPVRRLRRKSRLWDLVIDRPKVKGGPRSRGKLYRLAVPDSTHPA